MINPFEISETVSIVVASENVMHALETEVGIAPRQSQQRAVSSRILSMTQESIANRMTLEGE